MPIGGIPTGWDIRVMYYRSYLSSLERFLENEAKILDERYEAEVRKAIEGKERVNCGDYTLPGQLSEEERGALECFFFEEEYELEDIFPNMLRRSFFVSIYSLIEAQLNAICHEQERSKGLQSSVEDFTEPDMGIGRARKYLVNEARIRFPDSEWTKLRDYQKLRNCIVHNEGKLESGHEKHERARKYLKEQFIRHNRNHLEWKDLDDEIIFHKGFCEEVLQVSRRFFTDLFAALTSEEEGDF
jgi:hypothetical protein